MAQPRFDTGAAPRPHKVNFRAEAKDGNLEIDVYDVVGDDWYGITARQVRDALRANPDAKAITVRIDSPGGSAFDGYAIHDALKAHAAPVTVIVESLAASAASIIAMAGDTIEIAANAFVMIHNSWLITLGDAADHIGAADLLAKVDANALKLYAGRSGQSEESIKAWMDAETWFTADQAIELGFADKKSGSETGANQRIAAAPAFKFRNLPDALKVRFSAQASRPERAKETNMEADANLKALLARMGVDTVKDAHAAIDTHTQLVSALMSSTGTKSPSDAIDAVTANATHCKAVADLAGATGEAALGVLAAFKASHEALPGAQAKLAEHEASQKAAEAEAVKAKHAALVKQGVESGKLVKAQLEWAETQSCESLEAFLRVAPAAVPGAGAKATTEGAVHAVELSQSDIDAAERLGISPEQFRAEKLKRTTSQRVAVEDTED